MAISKKKTERQQKTFCFLWNSCLCLNICECVENHREWKACKRQTTKSRKHWQGLQTPLSEEHRCPEKEGMRMHWTCKPCFSMKRRHKPTNNHKGKITIWKQAASKTASVSNLSFLFCVYLVDPARHICLCKGLSHANVSIETRTLETVNGLLKKVIIYLNGGTTNSSKYICG
jgi:hypothetical protein